MVKGGHARGNVPRGCAEVDEGPAFALRIPWPNGRNANFHFERGGDSVAGFEAVIFGRMPMGMQVDKSGKVHQTFRVDDGSAAQCARRYGGNFAARDADAANRIEAGGRIHYAAVGNHQIVALAVKRRGGGKAEREKADRHGSLLLMDDITILILGDPAEAALKRLDLGPGVTIKISKTAEEFGPALAAARVLYSCTGSRVEIKLVLDGAPGLEWIQTRSAGLDSVLFPELVASPIPLTNGSGVFSQSLGEFVIAGALYFAKDMPRMLRDKAAHRWEVFTVPN